MLTEAILLARVPRNHPRELFYDAGGPGKKLGTNKPPPTGTVQERSKGDVSLSVRPESFSVEPVLAEC